MSNNWDLVTLTMQWSTVIVLFLCEDNMFTLSVVKKKILAEKTFGEFQNESLKMKL